MGLDPKSDKYRKKKEKPKRLTAEDRRRVLNRSTHLFGLTVSVTKRTDFWDLRGADSAKGVGTGCIFGSAQAREATRPTLQVSHPDSHLTVDCTRRGTPIQTTKITDVDFCCSGIQTLMPGISHTQRCEDVPSHPSLSIPLFPLEASLFPLLLSASHAVISFWSLVLDTESRMGLKTD